MAGVTPTSGSSAQTVQYGTNLPPISFPGISSGIDYNSIINKLVGLTTAQQQPLNTKVTQLNSANTELIKINSLVQTLQGTLLALSDPNTTNAYAATVSDPTAALASQVSGAAATPGTYFVLSATPATSTQLDSNPAAGAAIDPTQTLANAGFAITPSNGGQTSGKITINGVTFNYDTASTTLNGLISTINSQTATTGVTASYDSVNDKFVLSSTGTLTVGSAADVGNLASVLKLDTAPIVPGGGGSSSITSSGRLGGINEYVTLNTGGNAGFASVVSSGTFTINGVSINVNAQTQSVANILSEINNSTAGVVATYDVNSATILLTNKSTGAHGIVVSDGSSNFASAAHLIASGTNAATLTVGSPAQVTYTDPSGTSHTVYSASNNVTNVIPGIQLTLEKATTTGFSVNVAQSSTALVSSVNAFTSAYNAVLNEINTATVAPVIGTSSDKNGQQVGTALSNGGVLYNNQGVLNLRDQLIKLVSATFGNNSTYNSLASLGLNLTSNFSVTTATSSSAATGATPGSTSNGNQTSLSSQVYSGTDGTFTALDVSKLEAALSANPVAVAGIFSGSTGLAVQLGTYLTGVTGAPTILNSGPVGTIPNLGPNTNSILSSLQYENSQNITALQQQIQSITDQANLQADTLRKEFSASESQIAGLQAIQQQVTSAINSGAL